MNIPSVFIILLIVVSLQFAGCAAHKGNRLISPRDCLQRLTHRMEKAPKQNFLLTLDSQQVQLSEFFQQCQTKMPFCALPDKFYHWQREVKIIASKTPRGEVSHKVRIYFNYLSTCEPEQIDPKKTHGDIAEFYDAKGEFMGLAVYTGNGLYCPLPYSKYSGDGGQLQFYTHNS